MSCRKIFTLRRQQSRSPDQHDEEIEERSELKVRRHENASQSRHCHRTVKSNAKSERDSIAVIDV